MTTPREIHASAVAALDLVMNAEGPPDADTFEAIRVALLDIANATDDVRSPGDAAAPRRIRDALVRSDEGGYGSAWYFYVDRRDVESVLEELCGAPWRTRGRTAPAVIVEPPSPEAIARAVDGKLVVGVDVAEGVPGGMTIVVFLDDGDGTLTFLGTAEQTHLDDDGAEDAARAAGVCCGDPGDCQGGCSA